MEHYFKLLEGMAQRIVLRYETESGEPLPVGGYVASGMAWATGGSPRLFDVDMREDSVVLTVPGLWAVGLPWQYCVMVREKNTEISWPVLTGEITVEPMPCGGGVAPGEIEAVACLSSETLDVTVKLGESTASCSVAVEKAVVAAGEAEAYYKKMQELAINTRGPQGEPGAPGAPGKDAEITKEALEAVLPVACTAEGLARADVSGVLVVGAGARARSENQVIIGNAACGETVASRVVVLGDGAEVGRASAEALAVGAGAKVSYESAEAVAVGARAAASARKSVAQGWRASAGGMGSVALGSESRAVGAGDVIVGSGAYSENIGQDRVAVGRDAVARGNNAVGVGAIARAVGENALAVGYNVRAEVDAVAVGVGAFAAERGAAFGNYAHAGAHALALGGGAVAEKNSVVLQCGSADGVRFSLEMVAGEATGERGSVCGEDSQAFLRGGAFRFRVRDILSGAEEVCTFSIGALFKALQGLGAVVEMQADGYSYGKGDA